MEELDEAMKEIQASIDEFIQPPTAAAEGSDDESDSEDEEEEGGWSLNFFVYIISCGDLYSS